jgi:peptide/nickel transport system permease protein
MRRYIIRRLFHAAGLLAIMSVVFFTMVHLIPGAYIPAARAHNLGLDQPLPVQYLTWLSHTLQGNFGDSLVYRRPVGTEILERLPSTLELFLAAFALALVIALLGGVYAAVHRNSLSDYTITVAAYAGIAMPNFWVALILQELFGVQLGWLPTFGRTSIPSVAAGGLTPLQSLTDYTRHLILPAVVLSLQFTAQWSRYLRSSVIDVISQDYVRTAQMKGLSERAVFWRHALRNALIPFITVVALSFGSMASGAVVIETVFAWPGMGSLFFGALNLPDYPTLLAILMIGAASVILFNLVADVLYVAADPRIRYT